LYSLTKNDEVLGNITKNKMEDEFGYTYKVNKMNRNQGILKDLGIAIKRGNNQKTVYQPMTDISEIKSKNNYRDIKFDGATKVFSDYVNVDGSNKKVIVSLVKIQGDEYKVNKAFDADNGNEIKNFTIINELGDRNGYSPAEYYKSQGIRKFTLANSKLYQNQMVNDENLKVKYYDRAPYKGLPAQVPFDKKNGWYVTTDYVLSGFGKPYEQNGRVVNFWICNVGANGLIEDKTRDDCRYYNLGSTADLDFPGLSSTDSAKLVRDAQNAIIEAGKYYGKDKAYINGQMYFTDIAENGVSGNCADFMSPADCNLMFNVCDPVLCPASRCDFGGKYRVSNVVQSGIIGSLLLCLPNFPEVKVPICLSGVHAGLDSYISILKSTHACLKENLETGRNIGICDEIKSVYLCEFFWKQAVPLMDVFIPRMFELGAGQGVRGGGEYMTVNSAWQNMKASVDYFKNDYAVNSMKAFNERSTAEVGGDVCKMFVGARYPSGKDFFDNLIEPDSPVQYTAWFSEDVLTEATVPPTSHYKVYYHIYAGKDIGSNYVVYLKNPPESSYVHTLGMYVVDRGYIEKGQQVDEARDFTGVSGYTELCVNINGQEECGFKQVSTSWAIEELSNRYIAGQSQNATNEKECVAGTSSLWSFAQPNLQAGAQEIAQPELYKRGIIRVCSKGNPGAQTDADVGVDKIIKNDRWKPVGWCDKNAGIQCWLDSYSVENVLRDAPNLSAEILDKVDVANLGKDDLWNKDTSDEKIRVADEIKGKIDELGTEDLSDNKIVDALDGIDELEKLKEKGKDNSYRARAWFLIGRIYDKIAKRIYGERVLGSEKVIKTKTGEIKKLTDDMLKENVWIKWGGGDYVTHCYYKYKSKRWITDFRGSFIPNPPAAGIQIEPNCADIENDGYLKGIDAIAEIHSYVEIDRKRLKGENLAKQIRDALLIEGNTDESVNKIEGLKEIDLEKE